MQRLFSAFPEGWPGTGLVLLRAITAIPLEPYVELDQLLDETNDISERWPEFEGIVGSSRALRSVLGQVRIVAPTDSTALIEGELQRN